FFLSSLYPTVANDSRTPLTSLRVNLSECASARVAIRSDFDSGLPIRSALLSDGKFAALWVKQTELGSKKQRDVRYGRSLGAAIGPDLVLVGLGLIPGLFAAPLDAPLAVSLSAPLGAVVV